MSLFSDASIRDGHLLRFGFGRAAAGETEAVAERRLRELEVQLTEAVSERDLLEQAQESDSAEVSERLSALEVRYLRMHDCWFTWPSSDFVFFTLGGPHWDRQWRDAWRARTKG